MVLHAFRFGVSVWSAPSRGEWKAKARKAEDQGFDTLSVPDHLMDGVYPPLVALCTAAEATTRLRVGTLVLNNEFRHPALVARDAACIDVLTEGRFELGIGAGHMESEFASIGLPFEPAAIRIARLEEAVALIQSLLAEETVTSQARHYAARDHALFPRPVQQPIPMLIGGNGRRVLELAARKASIVGFTGFFPAERGSHVSAAHFTASGFESRLQLVRAAAGERFATLELHALIQAVVRTNDARATAETLQARLPGLSTDDILESPFVLLGTPEQMESALLERRQRFGISYFTVFEPAADALAPVVARLSGRR
jgi:probable F420-dependent oxidoreductase